MSERSIPKASPEAILAAAAGKHELPFKLHVGKSTKEGASDGVFLDGKAENGQVVALYPGVIFSESEFSLASSLGLITIDNEYLAFIPPNFIIDGNIRDRKSLNFKMLESCLERNSIERHTHCKPSYNPYAIAHIVNHSILSPNCFFACVDYKSCIENDLSSFIPTASFAANGQADSIGLCLVANTEIIDQELFVDYSYRKKQSQPSWFSSS